MFITRDQTFQRQNNMMILSAIKKKFTHEFIYETPSNSVCFQLIVEFVCTYNVLKPVLKLCASQLSFN